MDEPKDITAALSNLLDTHGYGFQYAVVAVSERLFNTPIGRGSPWRLPIVEFPVETNNVRTHIDVILEHYRRPLMMVGECKRANPALRNWCFLRGPYTPVSSLSGCVFVEALEWPRPGDPVCRVQTLFHSPDIYHLGIEVRSNEKGNPCDKGRGAIEEAAAQVMRGVNGLLQYLPRSAKFSAERKSIQILPVIFTTARLWVTQADLAASDLQTGKLDLSAFPVEEKPWLFLHYPQSPGLKHSLPIVSDGSFHTVLTDALYTEYIRPIGIVTAGGIEDFFKMHHWAN